MLNVLAKRAADGVRTLAAFAFSRPYISDIAVGVKDRTNRYCSHCGERVRHSANRCPMCRHVMLSGRRVLILILVAILVVAAFFLWLDYQNIEFFK